MITLLVKGDKFAAAAAASRRGIPFAFIREIHNIPGRVETVGATGDPMHDSVAEWFQEPGAAPFPVGACLHYSLGGFTQ